MRHHGLQLGGVILLLVGVSCAQPTTTSPAPTTSSPTAPAPPRELVAIPAPGELRRPRMTEPDAIAALRGELQRAVAADRFAGAVLVAHDGTPIFAEAFGLADRDRKLPNALDTQFRIGSLNKMFTATATLQLVQAGKLKLAAPLSRVLRSYPNKTLASRVTLDNLLTHTGGTGDIFGPAFTAHRLELRTHQDYVKLYGQRELEGEPGVGWEYSNYGFVLLGVVIETATGTSYYDRVASHVFAPAGMTATASLPEDQPAPRRSMGYTRGADDGWVSNADTLPYRGTSAGGGYSTVTDLLAFANALQRHQLLDAAHTALLTSGKVILGADIQYAYGFEDKISDGVRCYGHGGGAPGMSAQLAICDSGYTVVVLANLDPPAAGGIAEYILDRLPAK